jgi:hypothetical protein
MPRMNGTDLCGHLMEERPGLKMLVFVYQPERLVDSAC